MNNPKDKAEDLFNQYYETTSTWRYFTGDNKKVAKQCALICVDEIIKSKPFIWKEDSINSGYVGNSKYWHEVKKEIENL